MSSFSRGIRSESQLVSDSDDSPRNRSVAVAIDAHRRRHSMYSSWEDDDDDDDDTELRQHEENLDAFCDNITVFIGETRDLTMAVISTGRINPTTIGACLTAMVSEMTEVLHRLQSHLTRVADTWTVARERDSDAAKRLARLQRVSFADALQERVEREFGSLQLYRRELTVSQSPPPPPFTSPPPPFTSSPPPPSTSTVVPLASSPAPLRAIPVAPRASPLSDVIATNPRPSGTDNDPPNDDLPKFLASLRPKYGGNWCGGCNAPAALVPVHWSDALHQTLHAHRSAVPPPSVFVDMGTVVRTVAAGRTRQAYSVLKIEPDRFNDEPVRRVREYVDAELGVSETGVRQYTRLVYVSVTTGRAGRAAASVIGYLETELVTTAHVLRPWPSSDDRRPVKCGVSRIWVAVGYRRCRVGTNMLDAFRADHSLRGCDVAFASHEILHGVAFLRRYSTADAQQDQHDDDDGAVLIYTCSSDWYR